MAVKLGSGSSSTSRSLQKYVIHQASHKLGLPRLQQASSHLLEKIISIFTKKTIDVIIYEAHSGIYLTRLRVLRISFYIEGLPVEIGNSFTKKIFFEIFSSKGKAKRSVCVNHWDFGLAVESLYVRSVKEQNE